jgi:hypothetical protein
LLMSCPFSSNDTSSVSGVDAAHYVLFRSDRRDRYAFSVLDAPVGYRVPWLAGPELLRSPGPDYRGPHTSSGYHSASLDASVGLVIPGE